MSIYCGTDIIEVERIEKAIEEHSNETENIFSVSGDECWRG